MHKKQPENQLSFVIVNPQYAEELMIHLKSQVQQLIINTFLSGFLLQGDIVPLHETN
jgi:hypothetical protein